jgi:hypothetical protein
MEAILQILRIAALLCIVIITPAFVQEHRGTARSMATQAVTCSVKQNSSLG